MYFLGSASGLVDFDEEDVRAVSDSVYPVGWLHGAGPVVFSRVRREKFEENRVHIRDILTALMAG